MNLHPVIFLDSGWMFNSQEGPCFLFMLVKRDYISHFSQAE